jgi:phospholipid N-methyltransferase
MPVRVAESLRFLATFVRHPGSVGAVWPSSRQLCERLAGDLCLRPGDLVLEYGPGTGPVTAVLDRALHSHPEARYLGIELNGGFVDLLRRRYPQREFVHGSVVDVEGLLARRGLGPARYIISGLPFASLPQELQRGTIDGIRAVLAEGGEFRTFQYVHAYRLPAARRFRRLMADHFPHCERSRLIVRNIPPAYVLSYRRTPGASGPGAPPARVAGSASRAVGPEGR